jgi:hypothetical protein
MNNDVPAIRSMVEEGSGMPTVWYALAVAVPISSSDVVAPSAKDVASSDVGKADNERATRSWDAADIDSLL